MLSASVTKNQIKTKNCIVSAHIEDFRLYVYKYMYLKWLAEKIQILCTGNFDLCGFFLSTLLNFVTSGPVIAFELMGENCVSQWREALGPTDSAIARSEAPQSIRARFGKSEWMYSLAINVNNNIGLQIEEAFSYRNNKLSSIFLS